MFLSFLDHEKDEIVLILDISSGYVEGALVEIKESANPAIICSKKVFVYSPESKKDAEKIKAVLYRSLEEVITYIEQEGAQRLKAIGKKHFRVKRVHCVLSSPWYISQTKIIKIEKDKLFLVTQNMIDGIISDEKALLKKSVTEGEYAKNFNDTAIEILESEVIKVKLNGYKTASPLGKSVKILEVGIYLSLSELAIIQGIKEIVRKGFNFKSIQFHSFPLVLFGEVRGLDQTPSHFLLLDVREEVTDVSLIKQGLLLETVTLPLGSHFFVRRIAAALNTLPQVAISLLRLYVEKKTEPEITKKIQEVLTEKKDWLEHFRSSLKSFSEEFFIPKTLYLTADFDFLALFSKMITEEIFDQFTGDKEPFTVIPVDGVLLKDQYGIMDEANRSSLIPIESAFIKKISVKE